MCAPTNWSSGESTCTRSQLNQIKYVGETMRPLRRRLDEHRRALKNPSSYASESFSRHRTRTHTHERPPMLKVKGLNRHLVNILERKFMEAVEIRRIGAEINNREELSDALRLIR
ncbi:hypothetical protein Y032_0387g463 [Ancylostoma ceylanicum]|uniref:GIY-YIG domain-containing protein n=1 Tax=Ancylostoma ceylanicum TaxID=53326 RepID=A0A016RSJ0_9BILA|nr:hypothetical protein Y032_0387g463 [Ancylostoma ceylanicum]